MDKIRLIAEKDYSTLSVYWALSGMHLNVAHVYPKNTSYVYERNNVPLYAVAIHKIEGLARGYVEGFIRNPSAKSDKEAVKTLQNHLDIMAKEMGISMLYATTKDIAVHAIHESLGYLPSPVMLYTSIRRLE